MTASDKNSRIQEELQIIEREAQILKGTMGKPENEVRIRAYAQNNFSTSPRINPSITRRKIGFFSCFFDFEKKIAKKN
jgi:NifB/MoaA-like Fe-S oxidoreductase